MPPQQPGFRTVRTPDGTEHRFPAEATDAQIAEALGAMTPSPSHETPPAAPTSFLDSLVQQAKSYLQAYGAHEAHRGRVMINLAKEHPAATGATIAGIATAPFTAGMSLVPAMAFSGTMAGGGAAIGQLTSEAAGGPVPTPGQAAREIATQAAFGAAGEGVGRGVAWAAGKIGPKASQWLYNLGLRPPKNIRDSFGNVGAVGTSEGLLPNPAGIQERLSGVEAELSSLIAKSDELPQTAGLLTAGTETVSIPLGAAPTGESAAAVAGAMPRPSMIDPRRLQGGGEFGPVYANAGTGPRPAAGFSGPGVIVREMPRPQGAPGVGAPPTMIDPRRIATDAAEYVIREGNLGARALKSDAREQLRDLVLAYANDNAAPMTVSQLVAQKRAEQGLASAAYMKLARGGEINNIETLFHQGVANSARRQLIERIPSAQALLAREQGLIGLKNAAEIAADRPEVLKRYITAATAVSGIVSGHAQEGIIGAIILHAIQGPNVSAAMGIATKQLTGAMKPYAPLVFRGIAAAYGANMAPVPSHEVKR